MAEKSIRQYQEEIKTMRRQLVTADQLKAENLRTIEELRESQKLYTALVDNNPDWVFWLDADDRLIYVSQASLRLTGYEPEEFQKDAKLLFKIIHPDDRETFDEHLRFVNKSKAHAEEEFRIIRKDRKTRWISHICQPVYDIEGRYAGAISSNRDITEVRTAEPISPEGTKFYRLIAENMGDVVWTANLDLQMTYVSPSVSLLRGYPAGEAVMQNLSDALTEDSMKQFNKVWSEEMAQETPGKVFYNRSLILPLEFLCKDGSTIWTETRITPLRDEDDGIAEILGVSRDITELRLAQAKLTAEESKLRQSENQLKALLNAATESIYLMDTEGRVLFANEKTAQYLGTKLETLLAEGDMEKFMQPDAAARLSDNIKQVLKSASPLHFQEETRNQTISSSIYPAIGEDGKISALAVFSLDITERKNANAALARNAKLLEEAKSESSRLEKSLRKTEIEMGEIQNLLQEAENISRQFENKLKQTEIRLLENQKLLGESEKKSVQLESQLRDIQTRLSKNRNLLDASETKLTRSELNLKQIENKLRESQDELAQTQERVRKLENQLAEAQNRLSESGNQLGVTSGKLAHSEERLTQMENRLLALLNGAPEAVFIMGADGLVLQANEAAAAQLGTDLASLESEQNIFDLMPQETAEKHKKYSAEVLRTGMPMQYEDEHNGKMFVRCLYPVAGKDGPAGQLAVYTVDVSERKMAGRKIEENIRMASAIEDLAQKEARYRSLFENNNMPLVLIDPLNGSIVEANEAAARTSGLSRQELTARKLSEITGLSPRETARQINKVLSGRSEYINLKYQQADGSGREARLFGTRVGPDGKTLLYGTIGPVSSRGADEHGAQQQNKSEILEILAEDIAREFSNLMTVVQGNIDVALFALPEGDAALQNLQDAQNAIEQTTVLTGRLVALSADRQMDQKPQWLGNLLSDAAEKVTGEEKAQLILDLPLDLWPVTVEPNMIRQCFDHLVTNALEAMPDGGTLIIRATNEDITEDTALPLAEGPYLKISFEDTGTGIPAEYISKIFDPYFCAGRTGENRGLGLAICHAIVKKHGGYITASSREGRGATFIVYLPACPGAEVEEAPDTEEDPQKPKRVLVMDDHEDILKILSAYLQKLGFAPTSVSDGLTALETYQEALAEGDAFSAVLMEMSVKQGLGGKATLDRLKKIDPDVKAVAIIASDANPGAGEYLDFGFKGVLGKPFRMEDMKKTLSEVI